MNKIQVYAIMYLEQKIKTTNNIISRMKTRPLDEQEIQHLALLNNMLIEYEKDLRAIHIEKTLN